MQVRTAPVFAALPALVGSLLVMSAAGAGQMVMVQQVAVSAIAATSSWNLARARATARPIASRSVIIVVALLALAVPMVASTEPPHRWLTIAGLRLYMAALILPATVLILSDAWLEAAPPSARMPTAVILTTLAMAALLAAHPDASQMTALAGAMTVTLLRSFRRPLPTLVTIVVLAACSLFAWRQPDPLLPVPYVEGVLDVAASAGWLAWLAAIACLAVPPVVLAWRASTTGKRALLAPAVYYVIIDVMAWRQLTPMPLLGFGASPILGYFLMAGLAALAGDIPTTGGDRNRTSARRCGTHLLQWLAVLRDVPDPARLRDEVSRPDSGRR